MAGVGVVATARSGLATILAGSLVAALTGCALWTDDADPATPDREEPGPTLAAGPPPGDWQDVRSPTGLVYSVPPEWEVGDPFGSPAPGDEDWPALEHTGWQRLAEVRNLELVRGLFRRPLELWLLLDRALLLEEQGYRVRLGTFCPSQLTPRNLLLLAELDAPAQNVTRPE